MFRKKKYPLDINTDLDQQAGSDKGSGPTRPYRRFFHFLRNFRSYINGNWWITYAFVGGVFVVFSLILGSANLYNQGRLSNKIMRLENRLESARKQFQKDSLYLEGRRHSSDYEIEQIAREQYLFKEPGELIFVLQDTSLFKNNHPHER